MAERLVLHIGAPKSGTTYLQSKVWANREALRGAGVLVPGKERFSHTRAASAVNSGLQREPRLWERFVSQAARHPGTVLVSDEWMVKAGREQVRAVLDTLGDTEVHVLFTARDLTRQVPAGWQEEVKLGRGCDLEGFVAQLDDASEKWSWRTLDPAHVLPEWAAHLPGQRLHVVTVPRPGAPRDLLWSRYAEAIGFDPSVATASATEENESLGVAAARFYQEVGPRVREAVGADTGRWQTQYRWLRRYLGHEVLVPLGGDRIALPPELHARVREQAVRSAEAVAASDWRVVGDLDDLVGPTEPSGRRPDSVSEAELMEVAAAVTGHLLAELRRVVEDHDRQEPQA